MARSSAPSACPERQRGAALITAVLAVAFGASAAVALNYQTFLELRRTQNVLARLQGAAYAQAAEGVALQILHEDREANDIDGPGDPWLEELPPIPLDDGATVMLDIVDLQGRFNLNATAAGSEEHQEVAQRRLARLFAVAYPEYQTGLEVAVADWIDEDTEIRFPDGAEDDVYTRLDPPYRPGNTAMVDSSELRLVWGMDGATWEAVRPFVTALPNADTPINVNTAPLEVLVALAPDIDPGEAEAAIETRARQPFTDVSAFRTAFPSFAQPTLAADALSVTSQYFLVHAEVAMDRARVSSYSVVHRPPSGPLRVIYRSRSQP